MLTNPNTLGIFDANIEEIAARRARRGGDALLRRRQPQRGHGHLAPGRHGLRHRALQPAQVLHPAPRRRRPRLGPDRGLRPHRALPAAPGHHARATTVASTSTTTGRSRSASCAASRATTAASCAPTPTSARWAPRGSRTPRETAVLNANYLLARLRKLGVADQLPLAFGELCMHEFVLSGAPMKRELQIRTLDLAKRLLDHGFHPPTVYFPLLVDEALLIEPTETETRETLDAFADVVAGDPARGARGPRPSPARRPTRRRCAASTRRRRRSARSSARRCSRWTFLRTVGERTRRWTLPAHGGRVDAATLGAGCVRLGIGRRSGSPMTVCSEGGQHGEPRDVPPHPAEGRRRGLRRADDLPSPGRRTPSRASPATRSSRGSTSPRRTPSRRSPSASWSGRSSTPG